MPSQRKNYYAILGIPSNADSEQIKKAYRRLMKENHPDKATQNTLKATEITKEIVEAYGVLSNLLQRREYDLGRDNVPSPKAENSEPSSSEAANSEPSFSKAEYSKPDPSKLITTLLRSEYSNPSFYKAKNLTLSLNESEQPLDSIYDIEKLSRELQEDAKKYNNNEYFDGYGYRVTSKWRLNPLLSQNCIYLTKLMGDNLAENCKIMGSFVRMSFEKGFNGNIRFKIAFGGPADNPSNILMLLKLGMIPEAQVQYLSLFGILGDDMREALTALNACKTPNELSDEHSETLVQMIKHGRKVKALSVKSISENIIEEVISKEVLFRHKDVLVALQNKEILSPKVIADILKAIAKFGDSEHYTLPPELINVTLVMSEEGINRWEGAIIENKAFEPFFALEHLEQLLSEEQIEELSTGFSKYRSLRQDILTHSIDSFFNTKRASTNSTIEDVIVGYAI